MPLSFYLLKPVKRVTEYPLLVEKLLKHTPIDHADYHNTQVLAYASYTAVHKFKIQYLFQELNYTTETERNYWYLFKGFINFIVLGGARES
jgi:hypothetical protein